MLGDVMRRRVVLSAILVLPLLGGAWAGARAAPAKVAAPPATRPAITTVTVVSDPAPSPPAALVAAATPVPSSPRQGPAPPPPLPGRPQFDPPGPTGCDSSHVPHADGFAPMRGSGSDTLTAPGQQPTRYPVWPRNVPLQAVCVAAQADGTVEVQYYLQAVGPDTDVFDVSMGPGGLVLLGLTPGRSGNGFATIPLGERLGGWPASQCAAIHLADAGPDHARIDDTLCFAADGWLEHVDLSEAATTPQGWSRNLDAHLDRQTGP